MRQKTLRSPISCSGIALHSGKKTTLTLKPAPVNSGICFVRTDVAATDDGSPSNAKATIRAQWDKVVDTRLCTVLANDHGVTLATVEHLMAALAGCAIDNAIIEVDGPEIPAMDGSAAPFVLLLECAGIKEQSALRQVLRINKSVRVSDDFGHVSLHPGPGFRMGFTIEFDNPVIGTQSGCLNLGEAAFKDQISRARTFGFMTDVEKLQANGLALGGSTGNAVVISGDRVLNDGGLRFEDEFVRHKMLDAVGDLYLCGHPIQGRFEGHRSGHALNNLLLRALMADHDAWTLTEMDGGQAQGNGSYFSEASRQVAVSA